MAYSSDQRIVRESRAARKPAAERIVEGIVMSVAKVTEITASSKKGFEDAIETGVKRASKTLENIQGAWVNELSVKVRDGEISDYRVNMKVTFVLQD
jgi:flavin-binding protein dodecin